MLRRCPWSYGLRPKMLYHTRSVAMTPAPSRSLPNGRLSRVSRRLDWKLFTLPSYGADTWTLIRQKTNKLLVKCSKEIKKEKIRSPKITEIRMFDTTWKAIAMVWAFEEDRKWDNSKNDTGVEWWGLEGKRETYGTMDGVKRSMVSKDLTKKSEDREWRIHTLLHKSPQNFF